MNIRLRKYDVLKKTTMVAALFLVLLGGIFVVDNVLADSEQPAVAAEETLVTVYDRGTEKTIVTKARTVREALKLADVTVDETQDVVEPALDDEMVASKYNINIYRARPITIVDGDKRLSVTTAHQTPALIAKAAGLKIYSEDKTEVDKPEDVIVDGASLVMKVDRATAVNFVLYGKPSVMRTHAETVGELLDEKNIILGKDDTLSVDKSTKIVADMKVELWRNGVQTVTVEEDIAFETEKIRDANRDIGYREVKQPGENGKKNVTYEIEMRNGQEVGRKEIASVTTKEPKKQIEVVGAKHTTSFTGDFSQALSKLRSCEGSYSSNTGNGYYGAYQFDVGTWGGYGGYTYASDAPPSVQDEKAWLTYQSRGWQPWPSCSKSLGLQDIYR